MIISLLLNLLNKSTRQESRAWKKILGFYPTNLDIYRTAITHLSAHEKDPSGKIINNERLEFLGDAVLGSVVALMLYKRYPRGTEGFLTRTRSKIVCRQHLNEVCTTIGLNRMMHISNNLKPNAQNIYGNAIEALIGAIYLDKGYRQTERWINKHITNLDPEAIDKMVNEEKDFKSHLYEWAQRHKINIEFVLAKHDYSATADQHTYTYQLNINNQPFASGQGINKRTAQQEASKNALAKLNMLK